MNNVSENFLDALLRPELPGGNWLAVTLLVGGLLVVLLRALLKLRRQRRMLDLQENELALQRTASDMHSMVSISNAAGAITYVNDNLLRTTGFDAAELLGRTARSVLLAERDNNPDAVGEVLRRGQVWSGESKLNHRRGGYLWTRTTIVPLLDRKGRLHKAITVRTDITESKLRQEEGPLRAMFDRLQDEVFVFSADTLRLRYLNKRARQRYGWNEGEFFDRPLADTDFDFNEAEFRERLAPMASGETEALIYDTLICGRPVEVNLQFETSILGERRFIAVVRDITRRREIEAARAAFVATVTHELRAPLTSIKGAMKLVASGATGEIPPKPGQMIDLALRNVDRLIVLINDLLDLEKLDNAQTEIRRDPVDLSELVNDAIAHNMGYAQEFGVRFRAEPGAPKQLPVTGDRDRLMQVLTNLMSNAAKFSETGGAVDVGLADMGTIARITVTDHGIGIPLEAQARLFERFVQADTPEHKKRTGTGLGLSIVKTIVERHGGRVGFVSTPGRGTTFQIDLPKNTEELSRAA
ncbi:PAS domain-containing sensor histidine kinase [Acidimangrovimonas sediminis]|uniref:PAS domain-containing sensor histidine kinase n=1 Tax=Acidimangrovimonas sediminis TaxID=2056283 RepID=UPI000C7F86C1|nr:PAS domain-containing sensor histidine kinase [Acidimangrovimonas sediminis]